MKKHVVNDSTLRPTLLQRLYAGETTESDMDRLIAMLKD